MGTIINSSLWSQLREPFEPRRVICFPSRFSLKGVDGTVRCLKCPWQYPVVVWVSGGRGQGCSAARVAAGRGEPVLT